jgi:hypothetical protein
MQAKGEAATAAALARRVRRHALHQARPAYSPPVALKIQRTAQPAPPAPPAARKSSSDSSLQIAGGLAAALVFAGGGLFLRRYGRVSPWRVLRRASVR